MGLLTPAMAKKRIYDITCADLRRLQVDTLLLDVDNTLTTHGNPVPHERTVSWLGGMRDTGMKLVIVSNNYTDRVGKFAGLLGLEFQANCLKPLPFGLKRAMTKCGSTPEATAMVGDQLFTDILAGKLSGCKTILVEPFEAEDSWFLSVKRAIERPILKKIQFETSGEHEQDHLAHTDKGGHL